MTSQDRDAIDLSEAQYSISTSLRPPQEASFTRPSSFAEPPLADSGLRSWQRRDRLYL